MRKRGNGKLELNLERAEHGRNWRSRASVALGPAGEAGTGSLSRACAAVLEGVLCVQSPVAWMEPTQDVRDEEGLPGGGRGQETRSPDSRCPFRFLRQGARCVFSSSAPQVSSQKRM